ncbi:MAG TPA: hypothetical protein DCG49_07645 [Ruminococcus sp.]|nr:hypothetical protein [Ruminococcus sp.]
MAKKQTVKQEPQKQPAQSPAPSNSADAQNLSDVQNPPNTQNPPDIQQPKTPPEPNPAAPAVSLRPMLLAAGIPNMLLVRLIAVFFFVSGINILIVRHAHQHTPFANWREFLQDSNFAVLILSFFLLFLLLSAVRMFIPPKWRFIDQAAALGGLAIFNFAALWRSGDFYNCAGSAVITSVFLYYILNKCDSRPISNKLSNRTSLIIAVSTAVVTCSFVSLFAVMRHKVFGSTYDDMAIFIQTFHSLAEHFNADTTCERSELLSHFRIHASYILYFLMPVYKIIPYDITLIVMQAFLIGAGVVPLYLIAKHHNFTGLPLLGICFFYLFGLAIIGPCFYDFHENATLPMLLLWLIWSLEQKKYVPAYIFTGLVCIVKEDAPLFVICLCMYFFFHEKDAARSRHGFIMAALSAAYMLIITHWLNQNGNGNFMTNTRFRHLMPEADAGLISVLKTVLSDPAYFFSMFFREKTLLFFVQIMLPLLFTPFMTKKIHRFLLMIPFIITNLVIGAEYQFAAKVDFQYILGPYTMLLYMCILNLGDMEPDRRYKMPILMGACSMLLSYGMYTEKIKYTEMYFGRKDYYRALETMLDSLPEDASIGTDSFLLPHVADRDRVFLFDGNSVDQETHRLKHPENYDIIVMPVNWYNEWGQAMVEAEGLVLADTFQDVSRIYYTKEYAETHPVN